MSSPIEKELQDIANILRRDVLESTTEAGSGHPSSCLSCAEIISCLFFKEMSFDPNNADNPDNDEFILSKGHAAPILYSALSRAKCINNHIKTLRKISSPLEGHPLPSSLLPWIKIATGSLGQGLSIGVGMALASKLKNRKYKTYVLLGDSESTEGSIYEALQLGANYKLNNLIAILDVNRLGQTKETMLGHDVKSYSSRFQQFGWETISINGHNIQQILDALEKAKKSLKPVMIIAKTIKGKGVKFIEDKNGWHGKTLNSQELKKALKTIPLKEMPKINIKIPLQIITKENKKPASFTKYNLKEHVSTRQAYGNSLANLAKSDQNVLAIDAEVSNSTHSEEVKKKTPKQFIEAYIAEQNMIGMSLGLSKKGFNVFTSTFSAFLTRAHDQIRMSSLSNPNFTISGSHAGVSIGEDGASQMGLEDISLFRSLPKSIILYPSDAISTEKLVHLASITKGIKYIRTTRHKTPPIYPATEIFNLGDFKILKQSTQDKAVIIGAGITLHESIKAYEELKNKNIFTSVIDLYCIKPLDTRKLISFIKTHGNKVIVVEDHYKEGGIGEMISSELVNTEIKIKHLSVNQIPHSGTMEELLDKYQINSKAIIQAVKSL
ncbi:MAG: transketolase [Nanoarchaeota archaeon]|nr:transketolase [Nanoarchaeota archaeon]